MFDVHNAWHRTVGTRAYVRAEVQLSYNTIDDDFENGLIVWGTVGRLKYTKYRTYVGATGWGQGLDKISPSDLFKLYPKLKEELEKIVMWERLQQ